MGDPLKAVGQVFGGLTSYQEGKAQQAQSYADAAAQQAMAKLQAQKIRDQAAEVRGHAKVVAAENGLKVDQGVAAVVDSSILQNSEQDAYMTILNGGRVADRMRADGKNAAKRGRNALAGSVLDAGATMMPKWGGGDSLL